MKPPSPRCSVLVWVLLRLIFLVCSCLPGAVAAATLDTHVVVLDGEGKIIPWTTNPADGYDRVMFLSWDLLKNRMPLDPANGLPVTYTHSEYGPGDRSGSTWPNNPAGKNAMLADSALMYYAYSGDYSVVDLVRGLLDHQLQYGTTPTNYVWACVPWSTAAAGSITYGNDGLREGVGVLEPDKLGELGYHGYLMFYELTGDTNYLNAAMACADALALHVRTGNATQSPWPFRVVAQTGVTRDEYCANVVAPIRLFDELVRLGLGDTDAYLMARQKAWNWLMTYPVSNRVWAAYFEDMGGDIGNLNQYSPGQTARYLLEHPELDPNWFNHVTNMLGFIETTFGGTDHGEAGLQYGARIISEQLEYNYKMASHTSRFAGNCALLYSLTGDPVAKEKAYRSLNWCTYMCRTNGVVIVGPAQLAQRSFCWFTDGHGDYIRHFMLALGAIPEWAPAGQSHIVRSTTVIKSVTYATNSVTYTTFDGASTETLRVAFTPAGVLVNGEPLPQRSDLSQPGWVFSASNSVLRIRHDTGTNLQVVAELPGEPPTITTAFLPNGVVNEAYSASLTASGGTPPYSWSVAGGSLSPGLTLDPDSGAIAGTPTATGTFNFTAEASDASNPVKTATKPLSITAVGTLISMAVTPVNPSILTGTSQQFTATGSYSDGSTQNLTSQATWISSNAVVATVNASGLATGVSVGTTTIAASLSGVTGGTTLTVGKSNATVNLGNLSQVYDGTARQATAATVPAGLTVNFTYNQSASAPTNVGSYEAIGTVNDPNYAGAATNTLTVTPRALSVVATDASRVYGQANPVFSGIITGVQGGDDITATYSSVATTESPVGTYDIVPALVDPGNKLGNYSVTLSNGVLTIIEAPRLLSVSVSPEGTFTAVWQVHPGRTYRFQFKDNLSDASWTTVGDDFTADLSSATLSESMGTNRQGFYHLLDVIAP